ncbi:MAG TPA: ribosome biogenesis GTPase YlqF [Candidatus Dormibacteraeota bacterium]|nr:ribosome biogenesis GTPase YlqF [Candidatus Dormibacteraeota bacterium]
MSEKLDRVVQWYPGHMVKAMRKIGERLALVDIAIEVIDARVVRSGANPDIDRIIARKPRIILLSRADLAEPQVTNSWVDRYRERDLLAIPFDARSRRDCTRVRDEMERIAESVRGTARTMIVGIPNSGKSTALNALLGRAAAKVQNRAGITRQLQWFRLAADVELMDTPGILMPKIPNARAQWQLALCGGVPVERYDPEEIVGRFSAWIEERGIGGVPDLEGFASARGFARRGGELDLHNAARSFISRFNEGDFGRISLERPDESSDGT